MMDRLGKDISFNILLKYMNILKIYLNMLEYSFNGQTFRRARHIKRMHAQTTLLLMDELVATLAYMSTLAMFDG